MSLYWGSVYWKSTCWPFWNSLVLTSLCHAVNSHVILSKFMPWPLPSQSHRLWRDKELVSYFSRSVMMAFCDAIDCSTSGFPVHHKLLELAQTHVHWGGDAIQPSHPLSSCSPAFNLTQHQDVSEKSVLCIRWPKYQSFSFSISPSNEYSGLISFRMDWLDLLAIQGTFKSSPHYSSKYQFFSVQLSWWSNSHIHTWLLENP